MRGAAGAVLAAAVALTSACLGQSDFRCATHAQCGNVTSGSFCEANGRCSVPDADCALSGRRYVEHAGNDSGACVARACQDNPVAALAAGSTHACLRRLDGTVACWGRNDDGQLGDGTRTPHAIAGAVAGLDDAISIAAGDRHTCAVRMGGSVVCWGADEAGQLGDGGGARRLTPTPVAGVTGARAVAAGDDFSCVLRSNGGVICWGADGAGQLGDGAAGATPQPPMPVAGLPPDVRSIAARGRHACALDDADKVWCWGANDKGQLGDGTTIDRPAPVSVPGLTDIIAVSTGRGHTCAATRNRGLRCWGDNGDAQVTGSAPTEPAPSWCPSSCKPPRSPPAIGTRARSIAPTGSSTVSAPTITDSSASRVERPPRAGGIVRRRSRDRDRRGVFVRDHRRRCRLLLGRPPLGAAGHGRRRVAPYPGAGA